MPSQLISRAFRLACGLTFVLAAWSVGADPLGQCGQCRTSFECADGLSCSGARCRADPTQCCRDDDCALGQTCQQNQCRAESATAQGQCAACSTSFQCADGLTCSGARCRAAPEQCCLAQDCPAGQSCVDHQCKVTDATVGQCGGCTSSFECSNDLRCIGARCRDDQQCCLDQDCPSGQTCQEHQCK